MCSLKWSLLYSSTAIDPPHDKLLNSSWAFLNFVEHSWTYITICGNQIPTPICTKCFLQSGLFCIPHTSAVAFLNARHSLLQPCDRLIPRLLIPLKGDVASQCHRYGNGWFRIEISYEVERLSGWSSKYVKGVLYEQSLGCWWVVNFSGAIFVSPYFEYFLLFLAEWYVFAQMVRIAPCFLD